VLQVLHSILVCLDAYFSSNSHMMDTSLMDCESTLCSAAVVNDVISLHP